MRIFYKKAKEVFIGRKTCVFRRLQNVDKDDAGVICCAADRFTIPDTSGGHWGS